MPYVTGRRVYANTQNTQTVKICTQQNVRGFYEKYYRIERPYVLPQRDMELWVSRFTSLSDLEQWLLTDRKAYREQDKEASFGGVAEPSDPAIVVPGEDADEGFSDEAQEPDRGGAVAEILDLLSSAKYSPDDDPWLPRAKELVEQSIDLMVKEFIQRPYLHRVEHSIHAELFRILMANDELAQRVSIGADLATTQLVHKEWPESIARDGNRRGNFDLAVLSPQLLRGCPSVRVFREGRLHAPIVIEIGLDYDAEHLAGDAKKLINSKPKHPFLVHLVRELPREPATEQIVLGIEAKFGVKTAYAWVAGGHSVFKLVNEKALTER